MDKMRPVKVAACLALLTAWSAAAAELRQATLDAFNQYIQTTEARLAEQAGGQRGFLWADETPQRRAQVRQGQVVAQFYRGSGPQPVRDGLIHDWIGAVFVPGATLDKVLALVRDFMIPDPDRRSAS